MALNRILKFNFIISVLLYVILGALFFEKMRPNLTIYVASFVSSLFYNSLIIIFFNEHKKIHVNVLWFVIIFYSFFFVMCNNFLFYTDHGNYFSYSAADSKGYSRIAEYLSTVDIKDIYSSLPDKFGFDDAGFPIFLSFMYRLINSNLLLNFVYIFINLATSFYIYRIGLYFLNHKNAIAASLIYAISSYSIYFQSSGLKETIIIFLIIASLYYYCRYNFSHNFLFLCVSISIAALTLFFRVPIIFFILISIAANEFIKLKKNYNKAAFFAGSIILMVFLLYVLSETMQNYLRGIERVKRYGELVFPQGVNLFVVISSITNGLFGPLPTIIPIEGKERFAIREGTLILKTLLSGLFFIGIYLSLKLKNKYVIPLVAFACMEIFSLIYLMQSFDLRKSMPHIPFVILVSIYAYQNLSTIKSKFIRVYFIPLLNSCLFPIIFFWNYFRFL